MYFLAKCFKLALKMLWTTLASRFLTAVKTLAAGAVTSIRTRSINCDRLEEPMYANDQTPWWHSNRYTADSACLECGGIIRCEVWCSTECSSVRYAQQAVLDPDQLSLGDQLILHALGAAWNAESTQPGMLGIV